MESPEREMRATVADESTGLAQRLKRKMARTERSILVSVIVVAYLFSASVMWAMITPIGGVPDEPAHITYAAGVVRGDLGAIAVVNHPVYPALAVVTVPEWVASITDPPRSVDAFPYPCYGGLSKLTADCAPSMSTSTQPTLVPTTVTRYPPPYYWIVGLPSLVMSGESAVYAMRIVSAALATAMIAMGLAVASPSRRTWLALGTMVAATPMVTHLAGSVNPSGLEISAAMGLGIGLMGIVGTERPRRGISVGLIVALSFAVAWARPTTHLTLIAVIGASALINPGGLLRWLRRRSTLILTTLGTLAAIGSARAFAILGTRLTPVAAGPSANPDSALRQPRFGLLGNLAELERTFIDWGQDLIGRFGWLDHSPPVAVTIVWILAVLTVVALVLVRAPRREGVALLAVTTGAIVIAPLFVVSTTLNAGIYQARYHLALATLIVIGAATLLSRLQEPGDRKMVWSTIRRFAILAPLATVISILGSLHRYSVGGAAHLTDVVWLPFASRVWTPIGAAMAIAAIGAASSLLLGWLLAVSTSDAESMQVSVSSE